MIFAYGAPGMTCSCSPVGRDGSELPLPEPCELEPGAAAPPVLVAPFVAAPGADAPPVAGVEPVLAVLALASAAAKPLDPSPAARRAVAGAAGGGGVVDAVSAARSRTLVDIFTGDRSRRGGLERRRGWVGATGPGAVAIIRRAPNTRKENPGMPETTLERTAANALYEPPLLSLDDEPIEQDDEDIDLDDIDLDDIDLDEDDDDYGEDED